jgi:RHH-type proline utilization regulon transcriptional repressor/proline dehydrogenase/delta 1-pyrroline-5-carboxylate dehydrogenase
MKGRAALLHLCSPGGEAARGCFFAPRLYEIDSIALLEREVFGPVVHLLRYEAADLEELPARINASGYGLTFGIHSRIQSTVDLFAREVHAGNIYVNRNIIGAVVGVQPFGGQGLSGTGPKAGGPLYLPRLLRPAGTGGATRAPLAGPGRIARMAELIDARSTLEELLDAQRDWGRTDMRTRFGSARALREARAGDAALEPALAALLEQAAALAQPREMPGPTGESNTLCFGPRGVIACLCREGAAEAEVLLPALAALLAGNTVLFAGDAATRSLVMRLREQLAAAGFDDELSAHQVCGDFATLAALLAEAPIAGVACQGDAPLAALASRALAAREGAILPLVEEDFGPLYLARFVHEKTVSVNTTASGGNAALMSQSESD